MHFEGKLPNLMTIIFSHYMVYAYKPMLQLLHTHATLYPSPWEAVIKSYTYPHSRNMYGLSK